MKRFRIMGLASLASACFTLCFSQAARAELLTLGQASGGQTIRLDTASISRNGNSGSWWGSFTYYLGGERINAEVHCGEGAWYVDGQRYTPQSSATRTMVNLVCQARHVTDEARGQDMGFVLVFDPPSNVRSSPNGSIICTIDEMRIIQVYVEPQNGWYATGTCGRNGWIHQSQFRAFQ